MIVTMQSLQEQVAWACRILAGEAGYGDLTLGHVSARHPGEDTAYIKRKGLVFEEVQPADVIPLDLHDNGTFDSPEMHLEATLHTEVYKVRPDVGAVIHGHPLYGTAFGATDAELQYLSHDAVLFADGLAYYEDSPGLVQAADQGRAVAASLGSCPALILRNHGVLVVGKDVPWAVLTALTLERALRLQSIARSLGQYRAMSRAWTRQLYPDKYHDELVLDYWAAWIRQVRRAGRDVGMPHDD